MWCWWCCHDFPGTPMGLPVSYDAKTEKFKTFGNFCGFSCMKAYNHYENLSQKHTQYALISLMHAKANSKEPFKHIVCAPPRQCLKEFGGDMDIKEFRSQSEMIHDLQLPPMVRVNHVIEKQHTNWLQSTNNTPFDSVDYNKTQGKVVNNAIKIKPTNNKAKLNTLDSVLGIFPNVN